MKQTRGHSIITPRDIEIFNFLWLHKLATTSAMHQKFFPGCQIRISYNRLVILRKHGFVRLVADQEPQHSAWSLGLNGFKCIRDLRAKLQEDGYLSENFRHDLVASAVLVGEFLVQRPTQLQIFTEQELRRYKTDFLPAWVPKDRTHRADGYWNVTLNDQTKTIALEVELSPKTLADYEFVGDYYQINGEVDRVLWLVGGKGTYGTLTRGLQRSLKDRPSNHNFVSMDQFKKDFWLAPIFSGPLKGHALCTVFGFSKMHLPSICMTRQILDTRKAPIKPQTSEKRFQHFLSY